MPPSIARTVFGVEFQNPILLASGTAGYGRELEGVLDLDALGGIVTKAVSLEPRAGNPPPRVAEFRGGMLNSVGLANPGLAAVRAEELPWLAKRLRRARVLVNVVGFRIEEYAAVIEGLDGLDLLRHSQQIDPELPVIVITGHGDVPIAVEAMRLGAYDFIEKPFAPERFLDVVRRAGEKRRLGTAAQRAHGVQADIPA